MHVCSTLHNIEYQDDYYCTTFTTMNAQYTTVSAQNTTLNSAQPDLPLSVTNEVEVTSIVTYIPFSKV